MLGPGRRVRLAGNFARGPLSYFLTKLKPRNEAEHLI